LGAVHGNWFGFPWNPGADGERTDDDDERGAT